MVDRKIVASIAESAWWAAPPEDLFTSLVTSDSGISSAEASVRLTALGPNTVNPRPERSRLRVFVSQFRSPVVLILVGAALISGVVSEWLDAMIIVAIVIGGAVLGFVQEYRASNAVTELRSRVQLQVRVRRDGILQSLPAADLVPGDIVMVSTGCLVPADGRVIAATDCQVSEAILTGETFPVEKQPGVVLGGSPLAARSNSLWMGTTVSTGSAEFLVVATGGATQYGVVARHLATGPPETSFERGLRQFGRLLTEIMVVLVGVVFAANVFLDKPPVASLLFAIALAVGIAPELLPAIMAINLAHGARRMADHGVIVRQLNAIENLGSMEILCTDKTGTLTQGEVGLDHGYAPDGRQSEEPVQLGVVNALLHAGAVGPLDGALGAGRSVTGWERRGEIPFDHFRKRLSVIAHFKAGPPLLICKGALEQVLRGCDRVAYSSDPSLEPSPAMSSSAQLSLPRASDSRLLGPDERQVLIERFHEWSNAGWRVLGVATKPMPENQRQFSPQDEEAMTFIGYLRFADPPKPETAAVVRDLGRLGIAIKVISGDVAEVTTHLADQVGLRSDRVLTGADLNTMSDEALWQAAPGTDLFCGVDPIHKERIINALRRSGQVVGFMGDGVNDAPALNVADVGISVESAADVAREAASFVLLRKDLGVLRDGILEGRRTFANTVKYISTTESANFGNMLSMAVASLFLPFLPLTATQVLLNNFLSDFPATTIATDRVDEEMIARPERWDVAGIRRFMIVFGVVSSLFDFATFGLLLWVFSASAELFRTGWFIESLLTELVIALVVRTRRPLFKSRPGHLLLAATLAVTALTFVLPYLPFADALGFVQPSLGLLAALVGITCLYVAATEAAKRGLYRFASRGKVAPLNPR